MPASTKLQNHIVQYMHFTARLGQEIVYGAVDASGSEMERLLLSTHTENRTFTPVEKGVVQAYLDTLLKPWNAESLAEAFFALLDDVSVEQAFIADLEADLLLKPRRQLFQVLNEKLMRVVSPLIQLAS